MKRTILAIVAIITMVSCDTTSSTVATETNQSDSTLVASDSSILVVDTTVVEFKGLEQIAPVQ
jgi:hypothetical protein